MIEFKNVFRISDVLGVCEGEEFDICVKRHKDFLIIKYAHIDNKGRLVSPTLAKGETILEGYLICDIINGNYEIINKHRGDM